MEKTDVQYWLLPVDENNLRCQVAGYRNLKDYFVTRGLKLNKWKETGLIKELITLSGMRMSFGKYVQYSKVGISTTKFSSVYPKNKSKVPFSSDSVLKSTRIKQKITKQISSGDQNLRQTESYPKKQYVLLDRPKSARPPSGDKPKVHPLQRAKTIFISPLARKPVAALSRRNIKLMTQKSAPNNFSVPKFKSQLENDEHENSEDNVDTIAESGTKFTAKDKENYSEHKNVKKMSINVTSCNKSKDRNGDKLSPRNFQQTAGTKSETRYNNDNQFFSISEIKDVNYNLRKIKFNQPEQIKQNENMNNESYLRNHLSITEQNTDNEKVIKNFSLESKMTYYEGKRSENKEMKSQLNAPRDHELIEVNQDSNLVRNQIVSEEEKNETEKIRKSLYSPKNLNTSQDQKLEREVRENLCSSNSKTFTAEKEEDEKVKKDLCLLKDKISLEKLGVKGKKIDIKISEKVICSLKGQNTTFKQKDENEKINEDTSLFNNQHSLEEKGEFKFIDEDDSCPVYEILSPNRNIKDKTIVQDICSPKYEISHTDYKVMCERIKQDIYSPTNQEHKIQHEKTNNDISSENNTNSHIDQKMGVRKSSENLLSPRDQISSLQQNTDGFKIVGPPKSQSNFLQQNIEGKYSLQEDDTIEANVGSLLKWNADIEKVNENLGHPRNKTSFHKQELTTNLDPCSSRNCISQQNKEENEDKNNLVHYQVEAKMDFHSSRDQTSVLERKEVKITEGIIQESEIADIRPRENKTPSLESNVTMKEKNCHSFSQYKANKIFENSINSQRNHISSLKYESKFKRNDDLYLLKSYVPPPEHKTIGLKCTASVHSLFTRKQMSQNLNSEEIKEPKRTIEVEQCSKDFISTAVHLEQEINSKEIINIFTSSHVNCIKTKNKNDFIQMQSETNKHARKRDSNFSLDLKTNEEYAMTEMPKKELKTPTKKSSSFTSVHSQLIHPSQSSHTIKSTNSSHSFQTMKSTNSSNYATGSESSFSLD